MHDPTHALIRPDGELPARTRLAAAGFLSRYTGTTLRGYSISLELLFRWLLSFGIDPLEVTRPQLELYMRQHLEIERGCSPSSVNHHMTPVFGFYRFAVIDDFLSKDPCAGVRRPKVWTDPWREDYLTAQELRAMVAAARRSDRPADQGLIALLALLGLRIAEVLAVQIEDYQDVVAGHRVLRLIGKGGKPATLPLTVACLRMLDASATGRTTGPLLLRDRSSVHANVGQPLTYRAARLAIDRLAAEAGIERRLTPHMFRRGWVTHGLDAGVSIRDMQIAARHSDPRSTAKYDRGAMNLDRHAVHILSASIAGGG